MQVLFAASCCPSLTAVSMLSRQHACHTNKYITMLLFHRSTRSMMVVVSWWQSLTLVLTQVLIYLL